MSLRSAVIRLASEHPEMRPQLLPLLKQGVGDPGVEEYVEIEVERIVGNLEDAGYLVDNWVVDFGGERWDLHRGASFVVFLGIGGDDEVFDAAAEALDRSRKFRVVHVEQGGRSGRGGGYLFHCVFT